jgi:hypothetical protein
MFRATQSGLEQGEIGLQGLGRQHACHTATAGRTDLSGGLMGEKNEGASHPLATACSITIKHHALEIADSSL